MKRFFIICFTLMVFLLSCQPLLAHRGRTDAFGGHYDRSTGEYHYHHGYSAHSHYDMDGDGDIDCPYNFDDKTNHSSGASTGKASKSSNSSENVVSPILVLILGSGFVLVAISTLWEFLYDTFLEKHLPRYKINALNDKINIFQRCQDEIDEINTQISDIEPKLQIPDLYEIGEDNLPKDKSCVSGWGQTFTMYKTSRGTKLHTKYKCCSAVKPVHVYRYKNHCSIPDSLCKKCARNYTTPDMSWYELYLECEYAKSKRKKMESDRERLWEEIKVLHKKCNSIGTRAIIIFSRKNKKALQEVNEKCKELQAEKATALV